MFNGKTPSKLPGSVDFTSHVPVIPTHPGPVIPQGLRLLDPKTPGARLQLQGQGRALRGGAVLKGTRLLEISGDGDGMGMG